MRHHRNLLAAALIIALTSSAVSTSDQAVVRLGSQSVLPTATPEPADTGGSVPLSVSALVLLLILGSAITALSLVLILPAIRKERGVSSWASP